MHIWQLKCKSFQGPNAGPGPPNTIWFASLIQLCYVGKFSEKFLGPPWPNPGSTTAQPQEYPATLPLESKLFAVVAMPNFLQGTLCALSLLYNGNLFVRYIATRSYKGALPKIFIHMLVLNMVLDAGCKFGGHIATLGLQFIWSVFFNTTFTCRFGPLCGTIPCMSFNLIVTRVSSFPFGRRSLGFLLRSFMCTLH